MISLSFRNLGTHPDFYLSQICHIISRTEKNQSILDWSTQLIWNKNCDYCDGACLQYSKHGLMRRRRNVIYMFGLYERTGLGTAFLCSLKEHSKQYSEMSLKKTQPVSYGKGNSSSCLLPNQPVAFLKCALLSLILTISSVAVAR